MGWPTQAEGITALRNLIFDGATDKLASQKKVLGIVNGTNTLFKTFEYRRVTDFSDDPLAFPQGLYRDTTLVPSSAVVADDTQSGTFQLNSEWAPTQRYALTATYYYQWFTDAELTSFLENAMTWLGLGKLFQNVPDGLIAALLRFAAQEAYLAAAMKYSTRVAEVYKLEDAPDEDISKSIEAFRSMAKDFMKSATGLRDDYYTRQGQSLAPNFAFQLGKVVDPTPRR